MSEFNVIINQVVARAPEWMRHDMLSKEPGARRRAEEALAAMIDAALRDRAGGPEPGVVPVPGQF